MSRLHARSFVKFVSFIAAFSLLLSFVAVPKVVGQKVETPLKTAFQDAAKQSEVPWELLAAIAYAETHFVDHGGKPSQDGGYGLMHLVENPYTNTLEEAAKLTGIPIAELKNNVT